MLKFGILNYRVSVCKIICTKLIADKREGQPLFSLEKYWHFP